MMSLLLTTQVKQVFYISNPKKLGWSVVHAVPNTSYVYDEELGDTLLEHKLFPNGLPGVDEYKYDNGEGISKYMRADNDGIWVANKKK